MGLLDQKVAIITGGASGIGRATARLFVREGACVVIADIQDGQALVRELGSAAIFQRTDVRREPEIKAMIDRAIAHFGRLDCLFNNAGYGGVAGGVEKTSMQGFDDTVAVLLRGVFMGIKHAAPIMKKQLSGSIINTGSVAGLRTGYGPHVYSACKAAVIHLTKTTAVELGPHNVRVNCICPGGIATPIFAPALGLAPEDADRAYASMTKKLAGGTAHSARRSTRRCSTGGPVSRQRPRLVCQRPRLGGGWRAYRRQKVGRCRDCPAGTDDR